MKRLILLGSLLILLAATVRAAQKLVLALEEEELDGYLQKHPVVMLAVHRPTCPHCKKLAPEFLRAARLVQKQQKSYAFVKIDATKNPGIKQRLQISGYPTLKLFVDGYQIDYEGNRTAEAILAFIEQKLLPASISLPDEKAVRSAVASTGLKCILMSDRADTVKTYTDIVRSEGGYAFYHASFAAAQTVFGAEAVEGGVMLLKDFDEKRVVFPRPGTPDKDFRNFLRLHELPIVDPCSNRAMESVYREKQGRVGILFLHGADRTNLTRWQNSFTKFAKKMRSKDYAFIFAGLRDGACRKYADDYLLTDDSLPAVYLLMFKNGELMRYRYNSSFTGKGLRKFIQMWKEGTAERTYKSAAPPKDNPGPVLSVVSSTFTDQVTRPGFNSLVKFYVPDCDECKKMAPAFARLAEKLKNNTKIKFFEIDVSKNEVVGHPITRYPTIKYFPARTKYNPFTYSGARTVEAMEKFVLEKGDFKDEMIPRTVNFNDLDSNSRTDL